MKTLNISEIFFSIQGESTYSGLPCVFVRLTGCNLNCNYCDTKYATEEPGQEMTIKAILDRVGAFPCANVEVTGGEPLLEENTLHLMDALVERGYTVLLETNGSRDISRVNPKVIRIIDIKCPGSGEDDSFDTGNVARLKESDELKFVLSSRKDYDYAKKIIGEYDLANRCKLLISCVSDAISPKELSGWVLSDGLDVRVQLQLHKIIFGDIKGV